MTEIYLAGIGFGLITAEVSIPDTILNLVLKVLFFGFILFADKKLHWLDQGKKDDVAIFNAKRKK